MRSLTIKLPDEIAVRMEGEIHQLRRDVAELAGERLTERYAATPIYAPPAAPPIDLKPLTALAFDTAWSQVNPEKVESENDATLIEEIRRRLGRGV